MKPSCRSSTRSLKSPSPSRARPDRIPTRAERKRFTRRTRDLGGPLRVLCVIAAHGSPGRGMARSMYRDLLRGARMSGGQRDRLMAAFDGNRSVHDGAR